MRARLLQLLRDLVLVIAAMGAMLVAVLVARAHDLCVRGFQFAVSYEVWDGSCHATPHDAVVAFLTEHRTELGSAAKRFGVDERLIALAVAYEALENVHYSHFFGLTRSDGPGKVHYKDTIFAEGEPVAKQVEILGYLPRQTEHNRAQLLARPHGAFLYIAAIERAFADVRKVGGDSSCDPATLLRLYISSDIGAERRRQILLGPRAFKKSPIDAWVAAQLPWIGAATHRFGPIRCASTVPSGPSNTAKKRSSTIGNSALGARPGAIASTGRRRSGRYTDR
jgi:hypothetical protein